MLPERNVLEPIPGFRAREASLFVAQLDDQSQRLLEDVAGATIEELEWQPSPGMNSAGMLLAHIAITEIFWIQVAVTSSREVDTRPYLGIGIDDDGMPAGEDGRHPGTLAGKLLPFYHDLLERARAHTKRVVATWTDADLDRILEIPRPNGQRRQVSLRWILYHLVEHEAGHYGQINLLRHQYRCRAALRHA